MRLHLVLGVTLLMHSLEVKGGPTADIEGEEKTCKAFYKECKDVSECCEDIEGGESVEKGEVICGTEWDDQTRKRCLIKPAKCTPVGRPCTALNTCCDGAQCGDGSGKDPDPCHGPICSKKLMQVLCNKPEK